MECGRGTLLDVLKYGLHVRHSLRILYVVWLRLLALIRGWGVRIRSINRSLRRDR